MPTTDIRTILADYFNGKATWRDQKADDYPEDRHNTISANGLRNVADHVMSLAPDDERLLAIQALDWEAGTGTFVAAGEEAGRLAFRYGFGYKGFVPTPDSFLSEFTDACLKDAADVKLRELE